MKFQLESVVNTRPFSCSLYTFFIDSAARIQGQGWMVLPDSASQRSCSQGNNLSNQDLTGFGFLNCPTVSNSFRQDGGEQGCFKKEAGMHRRSEECWRQTSQLNNSTSRSDSRGHGFNHYTTQASQEPWFYGAFTVRCDHGHPHA